MLEIRRLALSRGSRPLLSDLTVQVGPGKALVVVGENGSGKSSLLRALCGLLPPDHGVILWCGRDIHVAQEQYRSEVLYVGHLNATKDDLTPMENLQAAAGLAGEASCEERIVWALEAVGLRASASRSLTQKLSQGQRRRVALARLWTTQRPLWILDEPFTSLDAAAIRGVTDRLHQHLLNGGMAVLATHHELDLGADALQRLRLIG